MRTPADAFQKWNRERKARWIIDFISEHQIESVLFVGSTGPSGRFGWENLVEARVAAVAPQIVWSSLTVHGEQPFVRASGLALPFLDRSFDLVLSNAVVEHVGGEREQRAFVAEHARVGRHWILTTPNRWFPVESHQRVLFLHWSERWCRAADRGFSRLLSRRDLHRLGVHRVRGTRLGPTFIAWGSSCARLDDAGTTGQCVPAHDLEPA